MLPGSEGLSALASFAVMIRPQQLRAAAVLFSSLSLRFRFHERHVWSSGSLPRAKLFGVNASRATPLLTFTDVQIKNISFSKLNEGPKPKKEGPNLSPPTKKKQIREGRANSEKEGTTPLTFSDVKKYKILKLS